MYPWQVRYIIQLPTFFWKFYFENVTRANFVRHSHNLRFCLFGLFCFFIFLDRRNKPKIILTWSAIFEHTCLSMILAITKNQTHPFQGWKVSSFRIFQKNMPHALREFKNLHSQNILSNDHIIRVCVLSQTDYFEWNKFPICELLICLYNPITRHRVWLHF